MRSTFILFIFLFIYKGNSQEIFSYEKKADSLGIYNHKEIVFFNDISKIKLSGTLIEPKENYEKVVIIVPGSGKDTRHSHFILTENLLKNGIGVFRFDERGIGKSEGIYSELAGDLSQDLCFGYKYLHQNLKHKSIGFIGHSLGGIAILEGMQKGEIKPDFLILIETPIIKNGAFVLNQIKMDYENSIPEIMTKDKTKEEVILFLNSYFTAISNDSLKSKREIKKFIKDKGFNGKFIALMNDDFLMEMINLDQEETLKKITTPTLYLSGTKDKIINHTDEIKLITRLNNKYIDIKTFDGLNHWLTKKDAPIGTSLYLMDDLAMKTIIEWTLSK